MRKNQVLEMGRIDPHGIRMDAQVSLFRQKKKMPGEKQGMGVSRSWLCTDATLVNHGRYTGLSFQRLAAFVTSVIDPYKKLI